MNQVTMMWVQGYEIAIKYARQGCLDQFRIPEPREPREAGKLRAVVEQWIDSEYLKRWKKLEVDNLTVPCEARKPRRLKRYGMLNGLIAHGAKDENSGG